MYSLHLASATAEFPYFDRTTEGAELIPPNLLVRRRGAGDLREESDLAAAASRRARRSERMSSARVLRVSKGCSKNGGKYMKRNKVGLPEIHSEAYLVGEPHLPDFFLPFPVVAGKWVQEVWSDHGIVAARRKLNCEQKRQLIVINGYCSKIDSRNNKNNNSSNIIIINNNNNCSNSNNNNNRSSSSGNNNNSNNNNKHSFCCSSSASNNSSSSNMYISSSSFAIRTASNACAKAAAV